MLFVSWNVNGLRACVKKGFEDFFKEVDAEIFAIQETKLQKGQIELEFENASFQYINDALYRNQEFICKNDHKFSGKDYWGSGHGRLLHRVYANDYAFKVEDVKNTMETMFAIYESAKEGKEIELDKLG